MAVGGRSNVRTACDPVRHGSMRSQQSLHAVVARTGALCMVMLLGACAVAPALGWQAQLERQIGTSLGSDAEVRPALPIDADPAPGDRVEFDIMLQQGERTKTWQVAVTVEAVQTARGRDLRETPWFEEPSPKLAQLTFRIARDGGRASRCPPSRIDRAA